MLVLTRSEWWWSELVTRGGGATEFAWRFVKMGF